MNEIENTSNNKDNSTRATDARALPTKKGNRIRQLYYDYRSEFIFAIILSAIVAGSYIFSSYCIPVDLFDHVISPLQCTCLASLCAFSGWLMLRHSEGMRIRQLWALVLFLWAMVEVVLVLMVMLTDSSILRTGTTPLSGVEIAVGNIFGWLLLVYPTAVLRPRWLTVWRAMLQVLPIPLLAVLDYLTPFSLRWAIALYPVFLTILLLRHMHIYRKWCEENFSSMENTDAQWLVRYLLMLALVGISYTIICESSLPSRVFTQQWLLFFMLAYSTEQILYRRDPWEGMESIAGAENTEEETSETMDEEQEAMNRAALETWMQEEKPYLNPEFKLIDLRSILPMNRTYLSQLINRSYGCTFYQFVTNYRIEEAKRLMREHPELKMHDIAQLSGFASSSVFSRTFTRETGISPSEWGKNDDNS